MNRALANLEAYPTNPRSRAVSTDAALSENPWALTGQRPAQALTRLVAGPEQADADTIHQMLFAALADMKIHTSQVAMHMDDTWRTKLFAQLDRLHDPEEWDPADSPIGFDSFRTLLRAMFVLNPRRRPGLSLANHGHVVAMWIEGDNRLTIECMPGDAVTVVLVRYLAGKRESAAVMASTERIAEVLQPYAPECWFQTR